MDIVITNISAARCISLYSDLKTLDRKRCLIFIFETEAIPNNSDYNRITTSVITVLYAFYIADLAKSYDATTSFAVNIGILSSVST